MPRFRKSNFVEATDTYQSPEEAYAADGARITREVIVTPGTHLAKEQALADFLGTNTVQDWAGTKYISRLPPLSYARYSILNDYNQAINTLNDPGTPPYCVAVPRIRGIGTGSVNGDGLTEYSTGWRMWLTFECLPWRVADDTHPRIALLNVGGKFLPDEGAALAQATKTLRPGRHISVQFRNGGHFMTLKAGSLFYVEDGKSLHKGILIPEAESDIIVNWHRVPEAAVPFAAAGLCLQGVNENAFYLFPPETLELLSQAMIMLSDPWGQGLVDVQYRFRWVPHTSFTQDPPGSGLYPQRGFNWTLRTIGGGLDYKQIASALGPAFRKVDFSKLFRPDP